jgi:hypothetical protein
MFRLLSRLALPFISVALVAQTGPPSLSPSSLPADPYAFLGLAAKVNGLGITGLPPWHVKATFQILGKDGKPQETGTFEEFHATDSRVKVIYASPSFNRTTWLNAKGSFATSNPKWPSDAEWMVRRSLFDVTPEPRSNEPYQRPTWKDGAPETKTRCIEFVAIRAPREIDPRWFPSYCFNAGTPIIRLGAEGLQYYQAIFNAIVFFHGTYVAREVELLHQGRPYFRLRVDALEPLAEPTEELFSAPSAALHVPRREVIDTDLRFIPEKHTASIPRPFDRMTGRPQLLGQEVIVQVLVNKLGLVVDARGVVGDALKKFDGIIASAKWRFEPYLVDGEPTEYYTELEYF